MLDAFVGARPARDPSPVTNRRRRFVMHAVFTYSDMEDYTLEEAYEAELIARAKEGDAAAADRLILAYGPAIRSAVSEYKGGVYDGQLSSGAADYATPSFALEDAQQAAILGVLEAIR